MRTLGVHYLARLNLQLKDATSYEQYYWRNSPDVADEDRPSVFVWEFEDYYLITWDDFWMTFVVDVLVRKSDLRIWGEGAKLYKSDILKFIEDLREKRNLS